MSEAIRFTIDGIEVEARAGQSIMDAADVAGIYIPRLCFMKDLSPANASRFVVKEVVVGLGNGVFFAILTGAIAWLWFDSWVLGLVIGAAMIINMVVAGLSGTLIPMTLERIGVDPAVASSVFLTTVTDVVGFFAFLGLAAVFLL